MARRDLRKGGDFEGKKSVLEGWLFPVPASREICFSLAV